VGISTPFIPKDRTISLSLVREESAHMPYQKGRSILEGLVRNQCIFHMENKEAFCSVICKYVPFLTHNFHLLVISSQKRFVFPPPFQSVFTPLPAYQRRGCQTKTLSNQVYVYLAVRLNILEKKSKQETIAPQCLQMITLVITMKSML